MIFNAYAEQKAVSGQINVISCGHIFAKPGRQIKRPNGRSDWLLFYVAKESDTFFLQERVVAEAGSFVLFAPGEKQHHIYEGSKTAEYYYVHFQCDQLPQWLSLRTSQIYPLPPRQHIRTAFETLLDELLSKQPYYEELCSYMLMQLLVGLQRDILHTTDPGKDSSRQIGPVIQHMNRFYHEDLSLSDYAEICCMSKYHFLRLFEQVTGTTPVKYRNEIRLQHAADLLIEDSLSVEEIGEMVGYSSAAYFSSAFKKRYGISPKAYRNKSM